MMQSQFAESTDQNILILGPQNIPRYQQILIDRVREKMRVKGVRGMIGLQRMFKMLDLSGSGHLDQYEVNQALEDMAFDISKADSSSLFKSLDKSHSGKVSTALFIAAVRGSLNQFRK